MLKKLAGLAIGLAAIFSPMVATAANTTTGCPTCDQLNSQKGQGGPGFFDWTPSCDANTGVMTVTVGVTTHDLPGIWTASVGGIVQSFKGTTSLIFSPKFGETITRWLKRPDGTYEIAPKEVVWNCTCSKNVPTTTTTIPSHPTSTSVVATSVAHSTTTTVLSPVNSSATTSIPGKLPATGNEETMAWVVAFALIALFFGWIAVRETRK